VNVKSALITFALLASAVPAHAYEPEELLSKAIVATGTLKSPGQLQYLNPFSEVGVSATRLDLSKKDEHEFSLNLSPKGISEAIEYKQLAKTLNADFEVSRKITRSQSLQTAYTALISAALAKEQNASSRELKDLMEKSLKLSSIEARRDRADVKNVLKANSDLQKSMTEMIESEAQIAGIKGFLTQRGLSLENLETSDLVGPEEILTRLEKISLGRHALTSQKLLTELAVTQSDARHATAQRSKILDELKLSMRKEKKENSLRLEVAFNLPFLAAQDLDDYKDSLKIAESEVKTQQALLEETQRSSGLAEVLRQKISLYSAMGNLPRLESKGLLRQDPALAMDLQRTSVALRLAKAALLAEIRGLYISLLFETETLASQPDINHLSKSQRKI
jgi:hypothetical protein